MSMKARIKSNGHIVNVHETGERVISKNGIERTYISDDCSGIYYSQSELEFIQKPKDDTDWNQVRIQAAIAAMQGMVDGQVHTSSKIALSENIKTMAVKSVMCADALVAELKKKGGNDEE